MNPVTSEAKYTGYFPSLALWMGLPTTLCLVPPVLGPEPNQGGHSGPGRSGRGFHIQFLACWNTRKAILGDEEPELRVVSQRMGSPGSFH